MRADERACPILTNIKPPAWVRRSGNCLIYASAVRIVCASSFKWLLARYEETASERAYHTLTDKPAVTISVACTSVRETGRNFGAGRSAFLILPATASLRRPMEVHSSRVTSTHRT